MAESVLEQRQDHQEMRLKLNCFLPGSFPHGEKKQATSTDSPNQLPVLAPLPALDSSSNPMAFQAELHDVAWIPVGLPAPPAAVGCSRKDFNLSPRMTPYQPQLSREQVGGCNSHMACSPRVQGSSSFCATFMNHGVGRSDLPEKIRHLGEILKSLDTTKAPDNGLSNWSMGKRGDAPYRRNWLETDFPALKENVFDSSRVGSLKSTPRDNKKPSPGFDLRAQLNKLEETLKAEGKQLSARHGTASQVMEGKQGKEQLQQGHGNLQADVLRDLLVRIGNIEDTSRRPRAKKKAFQKDFKSFASRIEDQLNRTDSAVRKVESKLERLALRKKPMKARGAKKCDCFARKVSEEDAGNSRGKLSADASDKVTMLEQRLFGVQAEIQRMLVTTDDARKQCEENSIDVKLCWSAMNQLCIDNETFRQELSQCRTCLQRAAGSFQPLEISSATQLHKGQPDLHEHSFKESLCGRWSCSSTLQ